MSKDYTPAEFAAWMAQTADYLGHYDASNVLQGMRERLAASVLENFAGTHTPSGQQWKPVKRRVPPPPLVKTGDMRAAALASARSAIIIEDSLAFDLSDLPDYWLFQQEGTSMIPARQFLGFPDDFPESVLDEIAKDVIEKMQLP